MKMSKLDIDLSDKPRISQNVVDCFDRYNFYYIEKHPILDMLSKQAWDRKKLPSKYSPEYYYNIDYKMLNYKNFKPYSEYCNYLFFLITSIDQKGIISPINTMELKFFHPGGKRVTVARYLGMENLPILLQTKSKRDIRRIKNMEQLLELYGNNCSFKHRNDTDALEIAYHGETNMRDPVGYDDWYGKARKIVEESNIDIPKYVLKHGLTAVSKWKKRTQVHGRFKTSYVNSSNSPIRIEIKDKKYLNKDLWELFFHIDPSVYKKIDETENIIIYNDYAKEKNIVLKNCKLSKTLDRVKYFTRKQFIEKRVRANGKK